MSTLNDNKKKKIAIRGLGAAMVGFAGWVILLLVFGLIDPNILKATNILNLLRSMAKYLLGPLAAFNVGLMQVFEYAMLEAGDVIVVGQLLQSLNPDIQVLPFTILTLLVLAFTSKKSRAPKAEGTPYDKGTR